MDGFSWGIAARRTRAGGAKSLSGEHAGFPATQAPLRATECDLRGHKSVGHDSTELAAKARSHFQ